MTTAKRLLAATLAVLCVILAMPVSVFANSTTATEESHSYTAVTTAPTCTVAGYTVYTCSGCGDSYTEAGEAATGHTMAPATCTEPSKCTNAGCSYTEGTTIGHTIVFDEEVPPFCEDTGLTAGSHCSVCGKVIVAQECVEALGHDLVYVDAKIPTYTGVGWDAYEECARCAYTTYVEIPMLETPTITDFETFVYNMALLEEMAAAYTEEVPGKDPLALIIKYIRTGVDRYNSGSWGIMAGYEDADFAAYVAMFEDAYNVEASMIGEPMIAVSSLKNLDIIALPTGEKVDLGHMFGTMDITYHNKNSQNHADVGGWSGDLVDLLEFTDHYGVTGTLEEMVAEITANYLGVTPPDPGVSGFNAYDIAGDLDAFYLMQTLMNVEYEPGMLLEVFFGYFNEFLDAETRADYLLENRFDGVTLRSAVREAVYNAYTGNKMITTLEATRDFKSSNLADLRKACCYAFADYLCKLAGDYVESIENPYMTPFSSESSVLAPGITQVIKQATTADGKQMVYYIATADVTRDDVHMFANYKDNDPTSWGMATVLAQAQSAQDKYGDPESEHYIENYNVIVSTNGAGFNMSTGEPAGLLVMDGVQYQDVDSSGFFGILKDGTPVIGSMKEYNTLYKGQVAEAISGFGDLIKDGKIIAGNGTRASRTAVGITRTGKVVLMVLDGRQEPISCGGSMAEIAQIMLDAGCVQAINLDGGGSTTYVAREEGAEDLAVINKPSDGTSRSVSTSWLMVSTAPSSTAFDHALLDSEYDYMVAGTSQQIVADGVSATGNAADLPEGTTWAVSDARWGTITEDGVFTALRSYGSVDIYLMLGDEIVGTKTMNFADPTRVYFTRQNMDAVYGQTVELPVVALYGNKPILVNPSDLVFALSNEKAGVIDGISFIGNEASGVKMVDIAVSLAVDPTTVGGTLTVSLYNQGEATFDFDQATGGNRQFAWYREVSNATTDGNNIYEIVDAGEDMVTSYSFAIDMTQIPIPSQLNDLIYMLPGAGEADASAWTFLLQLAERVSALSEVTPVIQFSPDVDVDYSEITVVNEYFKLNGVDFDEETNSLKLTLNWIKQTKPIDPEQADPLCILSGLKITPKDDAQWDAKNRLNVVASGEVGYKIYLRASALYSFCQKEENQKLYNLYPFTNPNLPTEQGGYFSSVYTRFEDSYTLVSTVKNGWITEDGGFAYYVDGAKLTGINKVEGYYYDFGETGINVGQTKYTGLFFDEAANAYRYAKLGEMATGWQMIGKDWHYFDPATANAVTGTFQYTDEITYEMDVTGKLVKGFWAKTLFGTRYYYGPDYYRKGWQTIDGKDYYFENTYRLEGGYQMLFENPQSVWYYFGENGVCDRNYVIPDGFYTDRNGYGYSKNGKGYSGTTVINDTYYYFNYKGYAQIGEYASRVYGEDYKAVNGIFNGVYYKNGRPYMAGLVEVDGDLYFAAGDGKLVTGKYYVWQGNGILPEDTYTFGADGKLLNGIAERDGNYYYYKNGKPQMAGLVEVDGALYFAKNADGLCVTGKYYVWQGNGILPESNYEFGADGKMLDGIVEKDGQYYYYKEGKPQMAGLVEVDGYYYFARNADGLCVTGKYYVWQGNGILPESNYEFGDDGKMLDGIVEKDGQHYYYKVGKPQMAGLVEVDGDYYFAKNADGLCVTGKYYVWQGNGILPESNYEFGDDGKMLDGIVEKDGQHYYYKVGKPQMAGLVEVDGAYYFAKDADGLCVTGKYYVWQGNGILPESNYEFGDDGKMLDGIVERDGNYYYYDTGKPQMAGLVEVDGAYYFAYNADGMVITDCDYYVWKSESGEFLNSTRSFGADGKMLDGFITQNGKLYYYEKGIAPKVGLMEVDGYYYFVKSDASVVTSQTYYVWEGNGHTIRMNYTFDEYGRVIG
ncbi:MAG: phosphodiester glycosidase family protein [Clostridia bacterium]|nr:phosphodiester glycosidase family protein [Clostridia bacterium]